MVVEGLVLELGELISKLSPEAVLFIPPKDKCWGQSVNAKYYILLTVHLGKIRVNNQLDALF